MGDRELLRHGTGPKVRCPTCGSTRLIVHDTRSQETIRGPRGMTLLERYHLKGKGNIIVRRRRCLNKACLEEFWTRETIITTVSAVEREVEGG